MDLISRQDAIDAVRSYYDEQYALCDSIEELIEKLPSAQERKKGEWITKSTNGEMFDVCSVCGYVEWDEPHNFCPNCGADMRGEEQ